MGNSAVMLLLILILWTAIGERLVHFIGRWLINDDPDVPYLWRGVLWFYWLWLIGNRWWLKDITVVVEPQKRSRFDADGTDHYKEE